MQMILPIADVTDNGRYTAVGASLFYDCVDDAEEVGDGDSTYCRHPESESDGGFFRVLMGTAADPLSYTDHVVKALVRGVNHGSGFTRVRMNVQQEGAGFAFESEWFDLTASYAVVAWELTAEQVGMFNGYQDLWVTCADDAGLGLEVRWTRVWLEIPEVIVLPPAGEMEHGGMNTPNPLLTPLGWSWLAPSPPLVMIERAGAGAVLSTPVPGGRRETRLAHERRPRAYRVRIDPSRAFEMEIVRQALRVTRGGASWTRWRSPDDPPPAFKGDIESAPRWRVHNAGIDGDFSLERGPGAASGTIEVVLEEV